MYVQTMMDKVDDDGSGEIGFREFLNMMQGPALTGATDDVEVKKKEIEGHKLLAKLLEVD